MLENYFGKLFFYNLCSMWEELKQLHMPVSKDRHQKRNELFAIDVLSVISPHFDKKILVRLKLYVDVQNPRSIIILISCRTHRTTIIPPVRPLPYNNLS